MDREHEINYAELERSVFEGNVTLAQCSRMGATHKAYGWSSTPPGSWNTEQVNAYMEGYRNDTRSKVS